MLAPTTASRRATIGDMSTVEPITTSASSAADDRLIERFIERIWAEDGLADRTLEAYRRDLRQLSRWLETRGRTLDTAGRDDLSAYHGSQPVSVRSMARRQFAFRRFYAQLARDEGKREDPTLLMQRPRMPRGLPKALAEREIESLIVAPDVATPLGLRDRAMLELMYSSGLRVSELVDLPLAGLNTRQGVVRVTGKGGKDRLVPVGEEALTHVEAYLRDARPALAKGHGQPVALFLAPGRRDDAADVLDAGKALRRAGRYSIETGEPARAPAFVRHAPAQPRRGPSRPADAARPQRAQHHADLHARR